MSLMVTDTKHYKAIGDTIRAQRGTEELFLPEQMSEQISDACVEKFEAGKNQEWSDFWDEFQQKGTRTAYNYAFARPVWNDKTFKPKYNIVPTGSPTSMFYQANVTNLKTRLEEMGVTLDTSQVTNSSTMFYEMRTECLPVIDLTGCDVLTTAFIGSYIPTIEKLILREDGSQTFTQTFQNAILLENIVIEGVIGTTFSMVNSGLLTVESMINVISALKNYKGTENDLRYKVLFHTNAWARLESSGAAPNGSTWKTYVQDVLGWNV